VTDRQTDRQTDGRTDGIAIAYTRYSIYAVARKKYFEHTKYAQNVKAFSVLTLLVGRQEEIPACKQAASLREQNNMLTHSLSYRDIHFGVWDYFWGI